MRCDYLHCKGNEAEYIFDWSLKDGCGAVVCEACFWRILAISEPNVRSLHLSTKRGKQRLAERVVYKMKKGDE